MELPRSKLTGYQNIAIIICPKGVTPECLNRGSTMLTTTLSQVEWVGGPAPASPGFRRFENLTVPREIEE
jgi:hypothetical protein